jgi:DNA-binding response OmpR family regulator
MVKGQEIWVLAPGPDRHAQALLSGLARTGHVLVRHAGRKALQAHWEARSQDGPAAWLLLADVVENSLCAAWLRDRWPRACVLACAGEGSQAEQCVLVQAGADWLVRRDDTPELLSAVLAMLWRRQAVASAAPPAPALPRVGAWTLRQEAWVLAHDEGHRLRLSTAERALLRCLFMAPGHAAPRETLTRMILEDWRGEPTRQRRQGVNLPVLVGRLRAKGRAAGLVLPIQAVRGTAYAWMR